MVIGHPSSMYLTDGIFLQTHVIFCEYCSMNLDVTCTLLLLNILNKKVSQIYFFEVLDTVFSSCRLLYISDMFFIAPCLANLSDISFQ